MVAHTLFVFYQQDGLGSLTHIRNAVFRLQGWRTVDLRKEQRERRPFSRVGW